MLAEDADEGTREEENGFDNSAKDQKISKTDSVSSKQSSGEFGNMEPIQEENANMKGEFFFKICFTLIVKIL